MKRRAKPDAYSPAVVRQVLARLASGENLASICDASDMPSQADILDWLTADRHGFARRYGRAREAAAHRMAEELVAIADNQDGDLNRDKLRVECRKWVLARLAPEIFGDRPASREKRGGDDRGLRLVRWMTESEQDRNSSNAEDP